MNVAPIVRVSADAAAEEGKIRLGEKAGRADLLPCTISGANRFLSKVPPHIFGRLERPRSACLHIGLFAPADKHDGPHQLVSPPGICGMVNGDQTVLRLRLTADTSESRQILGFAINPSIIRMTMASAI